MTAVFSEGCIELADLVDQIVLIDKEIKSIKEEKLNVLEEKKELLMSKIKRTMGEDSTKVVEGALGTASWVTQNRTKLDSEGLYAKYSISKEDVSEFTKINPVSYISVKMKK